MILSPLQEYVNTYNINWDKTSSLIEFSQKPPLKQNHRNKNFGGLAIFQSLRMRFKDP